MPQNALIEWLPFLAGLAAFGTVGGIWAVIVLGWYAWQTGTKERLRERMGIGEGDLVRGEDKRLLRLWRDGHAVPILVPEGPRRLGKLEQVCDAMGWSFAPGLIPLGLAGLGLVGFLVTSAVMRDPLLGVGIGIASALLPWMYLSGKAEKRRMLFDMQLADALAVASRSLRAGHPLTGAFQLIAEEVGPPVSDVFDEVLQQQALGVSLEEALIQSAYRRGSADLTLFAASVMIQVRSGGNLADTMERLASVIRDRIRLARRAVALTAQVQLSKRVLIGVPFFTALMLYTISPEYMDPLFVTETGRILLLVATGLLGVGIYVMNQMAKLNY